MNATDDLESGSPQPLSTIHENDKHHLVHGVSHASTIGTCGYGEDGDTLAEFVEVTIPTAPTDSTRSARRCRWRETGNNKFRCTLCLSASIFLVISFALICGAVLFTGQETSGSTTFKLGDFYGDKDNDGYESFWNPVVDLQVVYDPSNSSQYILRDNEDVCHPTIVTSSDRAGSQLDWAGVQPTDRSISALGILPHIQTSEKHFFGLSNSSIIAPGPESDWTLSFSGARLNREDESAVDIIFMGESENNASKSSFAVCYDSENSIRLGSCSNDRSHDDISVPLPYSVTEFHVLTLTYCQEEGRLQVYQNTKLTADFEYWSRMEHPTKVSWIGPPQYDAESASPSNNVSSNIALRHLAYLEKHIRGGNVVEIADLALHMSV